MDAARQLVGFLLPCTALHKLEVYFFNSLFASSHLNKGLCEKIISHVTFRALIFYPIGSSEQRAESESSLWTSSSLYQLTDLGGTNWEAIQSPPMARSRQFL